MAHCEIVQCVHVHRYGGWWGYLPLPICQQLLRQQCSSCDLNCGCIRREKVFLHFHTSNAWPRSLFSCSLSSLTMPCYVDCSHVLLVQVPLCTEVQGHNMNNQVHSAPQAQKERKQRRKKEYIL